MSVGIKELALLIGGVLLVLELRRVHRFARNAQTRVATGTINVAARMRRFGWITGGAEGVSVYVIAAICLIAFALLTTAYLTVSGL